ncbi:MULTISPECIES: transglycosylase SLT domain-containing protein [unclassified Roseovarius]|uniref:transglycosylase SLT domain-containing protein n=1 Tax=unclassified Roseovarius TaxID=2614913 RepID=UPI00273D19DB|nr:MULTISPECIES: transglycosylase SLT domain-containing protein [unclassified Roseovarius]
MTSNVIWTVGNAGQEHLPGLQNNCSLSNGTLVTETEPNGNLKVTCMANAAAAPAPGAGAGNAPDTVATLLANAAAVPAMSSLTAPVSPTKRDVDLGHLHPVVRKKVAAIQRQLDKEDIPMKVFEGFRSPHRQAYLYAQGRTRPGDIVTGAKAWESYHQYGLAADFVRFENGKWNWNDSTAKQKAQWDRFHEIAIKNGLEPLSFERPHVQLADYSLTRLMNGDYPDDGDGSWADNLAGAIAGWTAGNAPPAPSTDERPALPLVATGTTSTGDGLTWQSKFGGDAWAYNSHGVFTKDHLGQLKLWRTAGAPITARAILTLFDTAIKKASEKYDVPPALIVMTIAAETGAYRQNGFTGPRTFRWEQGFAVGSTGDSTLDGREKGDYSAGPMQVMSDTARWTNNKYNLGYDNAAVFPFFKNRPSRAPDTLGLYDGDIAIDVGTAYIRHNMSKTGNNPLLVAAAYNAGGIYPSSKNHWRIRSYGNHIDRAAEWYGDACAVLNEVQGA